MTDYDVTCNLPEAPCSTNARIRIAGVEHQITARGATAQEMAARYFQAVDALTIAYEARAKRVTINQARLLKVLACWMNRAEDLHDFAIVGRLMRAAQLVQAGAVAPAPDGAYSVQSQSNPQDGYCVTNGHCTCEDAAHHADQDGFLCKHALACALYAKLTA